MWNGSILSPKRLNPTVATMMIVLAGIGFGSMPLFAKGLTEAGLSSAAIAFYRYLLGALVFLPALTFAPEKRAATFWAISGGFGGGLGWMVYTEALKTIPVATVSVIYMTFPLFTLLIGSIRSRQLPQARAVFAGLLIIVAALIALSPASVGTNRIGSLIFVFLSPLSAGYGIFILSDKLVKLAPFERIAGYASGATLGLLPLILSLDSSVVIPSRLADWGLILGVGMMAYLLPQLVFVIAAPFVGSARAATGGSTQLPTMFVIAWLAFGQPLTLLQFVAGLLIIIAISITPTKPSVDLDVSEEAKKSMPPTNAKTTIKH